MTVLQSLPVTAKNTRLGEWPVTLLFVITAMIGSALLFVIQPMMGKRLLPQLGGSPSVWITCLLFFQLALLAGYGYAHLLATRTALRTQVVTHTLLLLAAAASWYAYSDPSALLSPASPRSSSILALLVGAGAPAVLTSASGPLLQRWLAATEREPAFLYAAGSTGSLAILIAYPILIEPAFELDRQAVILGGVLVLFALGTAAAGLAALQRGKYHAPMVNAVIDSRRIFSWVVLSALPASASAATTLALTTDLAPVPLLWVLPLAVYLASFSVSFTERLAGPLRFTPHLAIVSVLALGLLRWQVERAPVMLAIPIYLLALFATATACHRKLAEARPGALELSGYYLWIAAGGALGGAFNALVAPRIFTSVAELPLAYALALLAVTGLGPRLRLVALVPVVLLFVPRIEAHPTLHARRTFFGVLRVERVASMAIAPGAGEGGGPLELAGHRLMHGNTVHGVQLVHPRFGAVPGAYYHPSGPIGQIFTHLKNSRLTTRTAIVGLGAGALAAYGRAGEKFTFFEIDPDVVELAKNPRWFDYLSRSRAEVETLTADGRTGLSQEPDGTFGLIVLDAFSSDAVPVHLLTREAFELYGRKLRPGGVIALHLSNELLDLVPVAAASASAAGLGGRVWYDGQITPEQLSFGKLPSRWVVLSASPASLALASRTGGWTPLEDQRRPGFRTWTDGHASLLSALREH